MFLFVIGTLQKKEILITESHMDKEFCNWFASDSIFSNVCKIIPAVNVKYYKNKKTGHEVALVADAAVQCSGPVVANGTNYIVA